jgi:hypothetical protein
VFRPEGEDTWVAAVFVSVPPDEPETFRLRRVLRQDYGTTSTSTCQSVLLVNEEELSAEEERGVLDKLFACVPPLLMQHTLSLFVQSDPGHRRGYFERLLRLDGLTDLISHGVVGEARLSEFPSLTGSVNLSTWERLGTLLRTDAGRKAHNRVSRSEGRDMSSHFKHTLVSMARAEFPGTGDELATLEEAAAAVEQAQVKARQQSFPLLARLRPQKQVSPQFQRAGYPEEVGSCERGIRDAFRAYASASSAVKQLGAATLAVSDALKLLLAAGAIDRRAVSQACPVCTYEPVATLTRERIAEIERWAPVRDVEAKARADLQKAMAVPLGVIRRAVQEHDELLPMLPPAAEWDKAQKAAGPELRKATQALRRVREEEATRLSKGLSTAKRLLTGGTDLLTSLQACEDLISRYTDTARQLASLPEAARRYGDALRVVEAVVGAAAGADPGYRLRQAWLTCFENVGELANDLRWEQAKRQAQKDLETIRTALMGYRQRFLDCRRTAFTEEMQRVWGALRSDVYSRFSQLHIPPPRGKGFPIEIEVKATVDDGSGPREVDALRVFSESQVNALGVAAFITRSRLVGHRVVILDDPVQSMDEEHFKTFAQELLPWMLEQGLQVIVLSHNATFARDVSYWHYDRQGYVTMVVRHSRRHGCVVEEGNRRVSERLRLAEMSVDEGKPRQAWSFIRLALERLYTIVYVRYGPTDFDPASWQNQTAEHMWTAGAGDIIATEVPDAPKRLKEILDMTAAGGHDKPARGETDARRSIDYLRGLLSKLRVGG